MIKTYYPPITIGSKETAEKLQKDTTKTKYE